MVIGNFWSFPQSPGSVTEIYQELDLSISTCIINVSSPFKAIVSIVAEYSERCPCSSPVNLFHHADKLYRYFYSRIFFTTPKPPPIVLNKPWLANSTDVGGQGGDRALHKLVAILTLTNLMSKISGNSCASIDMNLLNLR